ncbi:hypothetical protein VLK31_02810 [Variovorax sp. H27-G14]|uniref:hypothetical protein n=1 Tax=Variovorax sp. H27-G14 TaxID=3111914 RepID=UPI0038FC2C6C
MNEISQQTALPSCHHTDEPTGVPFPRRKHFFRVSRHSTTVAKIRAHLVRTCTVGLLLQACVLATQAQTSSPQLNRLLPTDEAQKLNATFNQDGQAVIVKIQNFSALVVTDMKVSCTKQGIRRVPTKEDPYLDLPERVRTEVRTIRLLPGKATEVYLETAGQIDFCEVWEVRGRAKHLFEVM